jgi:hypothetical protein
MIMLNAAMPNAVKRHYTLTMMYGHYNKYEYALSHYEE